MLDHLHPMRGLETYPFLSDTHSQAASASSSLLCLLHYSIGIYFCQLSKKPQISRSAFLLCSLTPTEHHMLAFCSPSRFTSLCTPAFPRGLPAQLGTQSSVCSAYYLEILLSLSGWRESWLLQSSCFWLSQTLDHFPSPHPPPPTLRWKTLLRFPYSLSIPDDVQC